MELSKGQKIAAGMATMWLPIWILIFIGAVFAMTFGTAILASTGEGEGAGLMMLPMMCIFPAHMASILLSLGMTVFWAVHVYKNTRLEGNTQLIWMLAVLLGGIVGQGIYFFVEVWPDRPAVDYPASG